ASAAWSADGSRIVSGSEDRTVMVWDAKASAVAKKGVSLHALKGHGSSVQCAAWSPDGAHIVSGSADRSLKVWDAKTGRDLHTLKGHANAISSAAWSPDGKRI